MERALSALLSEPIKVTAAGRTDSGVHATGQVISFATQRDFPFERMAIALNSNLPDDVSVRDVAVVDEDFSARFSAIERTYVYVVFNRRMPSALMQRYAYHFYGAIDPEPLEEAAAHLIGEHDFRSVCGALPESGPTIRTVKRIVCNRQDDLFTITITADGFLHRMVRNIVGTLLEVGNRRRAPETIPAMLVARDRAMAGHTAPAHGLFLAGVRYPEFDSFALPPLLSGS